VDAGGRVRVFNEVVVQLAETIFLKKLWSILINPGNLINDRQELLATRTGGFYFLPFTLQII